MRRQSAKFPILEMLWWMAARLELPHLDLEAFWQAGEPAAYGVRVSVRAGLP